MNEDFHTSSRRDRQAPLRLPFVNLLLHKVASGEAGSTAEPTATHARSFAFAAINAEQAAVGHNSGSSAHQTPDLAGPITGQAHFLHKLLLVQ